MLEKQMNGVSRENYKVLRNYCDLLRKWNSTINLVSEKTMDEIWTRHIEDSLQLLNHINKDDRMIDVGSGAGLPGLVLSICGVKSSVLVECDQRKIAFLRLAASLSKNEVIILEKKIDESYSGTTDILTCRAFASLKKIFDLTSGIRVEKSYLLPKGERWEEEVIEARKDWLFDFCCYDSITAFRSKILKISNVRRLNG